MMTPIIGKWLWLYHGKVFACLSKSATTEVLAVVRYAPICEDDPKPWTYELLPAMGAAAYTHRQRGYKSAVSAKRRAKMALKEWLTEEATDEQA